MAARLLELLHGRADRECGAVDVRWDYGAQVFRLGGEKAARPAEPRVGEDHVQLPVRVERSRDHRFLVVPFRHVAADGESALVTAEVLGQRLQLLLAARREDKPVARFGRLPRGRLADPARRTRDEEDRVSHWLPEDTPTA